MEAQHGNGDCTRAIRLAQTPDLTTTSPWMMADPT